VNKACASGIKSIALGFQEIATGNLDCVLTGGSESMSRVPFYLDGARWGYRLGNQDLVDGMYRDGFFCPMAKMVMGETAEVLAEQYKISREEQDQFALCSQTHAAAAQSSGRFDAEIAPVTIEGKKGATVFFPRRTPVPRRDHGEDGQTRAGVLEDRYDLGSKFFRHHRRSGSDRTRQRKLREAKQSQTSSTDYGGDLGGS